MMLVCHTKCGQMWAYYCIRGFYRVFGQQLREFASDMSDCAIRSIIVIVLLIKLGAQDIWIVFLAYKGPTRIARSYRRRLKSRL